MHEDLCCALAQAVSRGHVKHVILQDCNLDINDMDHSSECYHPYLLFVRKLLNELATKDVYLDSLTLLDSRPDLVATRLRIPSAEHLAHKLHCKSISLKGACCITAIFNLLVGKMCNRDVLEHFSLSSSHHFAIDAIYQCTNIKSLSLSGTSTYFSIDLQSLTKCSALQNLSVLNLAQCISNPSKVANDGFVDALANIHGLRELDLSGNRLNMCACVFLDNMVNANGRNKTTVRVLNLAQNNIHVDAIIETLNRCLSRTNGRPVFDTLGLGEIVCSSMFIARTKQAELKRKLERFTRDYELTFIVESSFFHAAMSDFVAMM